MNLPVSTRRTITIEITQDGSSRGHYRVTENGRYIDGLYWDEFLGQIATMTHPGLKGESWFGGMKTEVEHKLDELRRHALYRKEPGTGIRVYQCGVCKDGEIYPFYTLAEYTCKRHFEKDPQDPGGIMHCPICSPYVKAKVNT